MRPGHGSPAFLTVERNLIFTACSPRRACVCAFVFAWCLPRNLLLLFTAWLSALAIAEGQDTDPQSAVQIDLRMVWGGSIPRQYEGTLEIDQGSLKVLRNLSLQPDSIGTIESESERKLSILPHSPSTFGGADVLLTATTLDSKINMHFVDPFGSDPLTLTVAVRDLLQGSWLKPLDERGSRIAIERQAYDRIRVHSHDTRNILNVGATWQMDVSGYHTGISAGTYTLHTKLAGESQTGSTLDEQTIIVDANGNFDPVGIEVSVPDSEGVYQLEFTVQPRRFLRNFLASTSSVLRRLEFLAFDPNRSVPRVASWHPLIETTALEASKPGFLAWISPVASATAKTVPERWQQLNPLTSSLKEPVSHGQLAKRTVTSSSGPEAQSWDCLTLSPDGWLAIPVGALNALRPHRLRVRAPADLPNDVVISIKTKVPVDGDPRIEEALGNDYRIVVNPRDCTQDGELLEYEFLFWPSATDNYIILANAHREQLATIFDLRIEEAEIATIEPGHKPSVGNHLNDHLPDGQRLTGLYLDKPLLSAWFGVYRTEDPLTGRFLDSWQTWQTACERLDLFLGFSNANLLVIKVLADGGAIYPSEVLAPTPRHDNGIFFSDGRLPNVKDGVELLLRHCERSGVKMVLALDTDSLFQHLEQPRDGSVPVDRSLYQQHLNGDYAIRRYDPLNTDYQRAMQSVIEELTSRYAKFSAFAGIQLQIDRASQLTFIGDRWGYGEQNLREFERETENRLPAAEDLPNAMNGNLGSLYMRWRATRISEFYGRLGAIIHQAKHGSRLYLNATRLWEISPSPTDFKNPAAIIRNPAEYLLALGIDGQQLRSLPHVTWMQGRFRQSTESVHAEDWIRAVAQTHGLTPIPYRNENPSVSTSKNLEPGFVSSSAAAILAQQPSPFRMKEFEKFNESTSLKMSDTLLPLQCRPRDAAKQDHVEQLYFGDLPFIASGAWLPLTSQVAEIREFQATFREFPPIPMADFSKSQPNDNTRVRIGRTDSKTYLQIINHSPWRERFALVVRTSLPDPAVRTLGDRPIDFTRDIESGSAPVQAGHQTWQLNMAAHDVVGIEFSDPELQLKDVVHAPSNELLQRIANELDQFESVISEATDPTQQTPLANILGDFEKWNDESQPYGWNTSTLPGVSIKRSTDLPHSGQSSLMIQNSNEGDVSAWIQSVPFQPPETGRLALQVWLRTPAANRSARVRISIVGRTRTGTRFLSSRDVGSSSDPQLQISNDWGTQPFTLDVSGIPLESLDEILVSVELIGRGVVWVDDVRVCKTWLHPDEQFYLQGMMLVAKENLRDNNPFPAEQLLDNPWGRYLSKYHPLLAISKNGWQAINDKTSKPNESQSSRNSWNNNPNLFQQLREAMRESWRR